MTDDFFDEESITKPRKSRRKTRAVKQESGQKPPIKDKFQTERSERINSNPLKPMNELQAQYIRLLEEKNICLSTGLPGTSKTYIPTVMACDLFREGKIDKIYLSRPNISNTKSLGYFGGSLIEKMSNWLLPVLSIFKERLGNAALEIAIKNGDIVFVPLETIKGMSFGKNSWVIIDEAEDLTREEAKKVITRHAGCKMVLCGDIMQSELNERSGLKLLVEMASRNPELQDTVGLIDFNRPSDIVRGIECKSWILAFRREENNTKE